jgi:hypothetical protein
MKKRKKRDRDKETQKKGTRKCGRERNFGGGGYRLISAAEKRGSGK